ncbi:hypothetical protein ACLOJK_039574 [Asimina triloba]
MGKAYKVAKKKRTLLGSSQEERLWMLLDLLNRPSAALGSTATVITKGTVVDFSAAKTLPNLPAFLDEPDQLQ